MYDNNYSFVLIEHRLKIVFLSIFTSFNIDLHCWIMTASLADKKERLINIKTKMYQYQMEHWLYFLVLLVE